MLIDIPDSSELFRVYGTEPKPLYELKVFLNTCRDYNIHPQKVVDSLLEEKERSKND